MACRSAHLASKGLGGRPMTGRPHPPPHTGIDAAKAHLDAAVRPAGAAA